jgi:hypothetical protein
MIRFVENPTLNYMYCSACQALVDPFKSKKNTYRVFKQIWSLTIAAPRLRPLFKDKQTVEGSDGCGLFVDNLIFLKIVLFSVFTVFRLVYAVLTFGS